MTTISVFPFSDENLPPFEGLVPANTVFNLVKQMPDSFHILYKNGKLIFETEENETEFEFKLESPDIFPSPNIPIPVASLTFLAEDLYTVLNSVSFFLPDNEKNYHIDGICLDFREEQGYAVATNGFSLAYVPLHPLEIEGKPEGDYIIPTSAVRNLLKLLQLLPQEHTVALFLHGNFVSLACNISGFDHQLAANCIDARFVDWREFLNQEYSATISFTPVAFLEVLKRMKIIATKSVHTVSLSQWKSGIETKINVPDLGEAREFSRVDVFGEFPEIDFDVSLLINALRPLHKEPLVEVDLKDSHTPMRVRGRNYTCLVMPCARN